VKLLLLVHGLAMGGTEIMVCHLARRFRARGVEVAVGCLDEVGELGERLLAEGIPLTCYGRRGGFDAGLPLRIAKSARSARTDIIHAHQYTSFFYGVLAKPFTSARLVFTEHGRSWPDPPSSRRRTFNRVLGGLADRVTAVSQGVRESLRAVEGFDPRRVEIIYNGIEMDRFALGEKEEARRRLGLVHEAPVIGTVGRLDPVKNSPLLLEAFRRFHSSAPEAVLVFIGEGPERPRLQQLAGVMGLASSVRFVGQRTDVEHLMAALDIFVLPSFSEGLPMTLIEAAAASVPIVATAVGGVPEVVRDEREALLLPGPPPDLPTVEFLATDPYPERLADAIRRILYEPRLAASLVHAARERVRALFSLDAVCDQYLAVYRQVLTNGLQDGTISGWERPRDH
jgi:glycosyltransferase involved in cell wall biosynthesis